MDEPGAEHHVRVLIVDDDSDYAAITRDILSREPYAVRIVSTATAAIDALRREPHDLAIIEHDLSGPISGVDLAPRLQRLRPGLAVVFTSSTRLFVSGIVGCFSVGADDYIEKPFHPMEFLARMRAVTRRIHPPVESLNGHSIEAASRSDDELRLDRRNGAASLAGRPLHLTATEFLLLRELHDAHGAPVRYAELNARVLGLRGDGRSAALKGHISALRQKLRQAGADPEIVRTERAIGYALAIDSDALSVDIR